MTVAELIQALQAMPQDGLVILQDDRYGRGKVYQVDVSTDPRDNPTWDSATITVYTGPVDPTP